jgi:hypothetical protein
VQALYDGFPSVALGTPAPEATYGVTTGLAVQVCEPNRRLGVIMGDRIIDMADRNRM